MGSKSNIPAKDSGLDNISKIENAEEKARAMMAASGKKGEDTLLNAKKKAEDIIENAMRESDLSYNSSVKKTVQHLEHEHSAAVNKAKAQASSIKHTKIEKEKLRKITRMAAAMVLGE